MMQVRFIRKDIIADVKAVRLIHLFTHLKKMTHQLLFIVIVYNTTLPFPPHSSFS